MAPRSSDIIEARAYVQGKLSCICGKTTDVLVPVALRGNIKTWEVQRVESDAPIYCPACQRKHRSRYEHVGVPDRHRYRHELKEEFCSAAKILNGLATERGISDPKFGGEAADRDPKSTP